MHFLGLFYGTKLKASLGLKNTLLRKSYSRVKWKTKAEAARAKAGVRWGAELEKRRSS